MNILIVLGIYLLGYILSYLLVKYEMGKGCTKWLLSDRKFALKISLLSWISAILALVIIFLGAEKGDNRECKW